MKYLIFIGSVRESSPPNPPRLGLRVAKACQYSMDDLAADVSVELIDPLDFNLDAIFKPHFAYGKSSVPKDLDMLATKIKNADGFIMVSPEYNHSMSPALSHLLNHFGSSLFSYKPSAIVTYSAGQWGGCRAAVNMRTFLSELGCLPVSAMVHIPKAQDVFQENGQVVEGADAKRWAGYIHRTFAQLHWWANAAAEQRAIVAPDSVAKAFTRDPSQRNAPASGDDQG
ncbi:NAD(P)H-dependent oxidoreductase [Alteromonadaceae bacterium BrNp21-10]|nr:NAD(P)H-dependent oxidoreductase [Alteromonadaceae bacterium BrNp21-10]